MCVDSPHKNGEIVLWPNTRVARCEYLCVAVCCSMLQCVAVCCSMLQCVAVCCSVLQCVAVCCSVLQCVRIVFQKHEMSPLIMSSDAIFYSLSYLNSLLGFSRLNYLYPVISVDVDLLPASTKKNDDNRHARGRLECDFSHLGWCAVCVVRVGVVCDSHTYTRKYTHEFISMTR